MRPIDADVLKQHIDKLPALPDGNFAGNHSALKALINMQPTIQPVATDTNVGDTISRQATIDAVNNAFDRETLLTGFVRSIAVRAIRDMPSVQPETHWIPCSERMPEEHEWLGTKKFGTTMSDEVYVTFENSKGERFTKHLHFYNGELSSYDKTHMDVWYKDYKPIAWMPLPDAYKEGGERI